MVAREASACEIAVSILAFGLVLAWVGLARVQVDVAKLAAPEWRAFALEGLVTRAVNAAFRRNTLVAELTGPAMAASEQNFEKNNIEGVVKG